jgi:hypothetical protein
MLVRMRRLPAERLSTLAYKHRGKDQDSEDYFRPVTPKKCQFRITEYKSCFAFLSAISIATPLGTLTQPGMDALPRSKQALVDCAWKTFDNI